MKAGILRLVVPVLALLLTAACVSTGGRKVDLKVAASKNMEAGAEYLRRGNLRDAKDKLDKALEQDPGNYKTHWVMGLLQEQLGKPAEAERSYKTAQRLGPEDPDVASAYAVFLCKSHKVDEALPLFEGLVRNPLYRTPWAPATNAAVCLRTDKRNADAVRWLDRALTLRKDYEPAVTELADLQLALGKADLARQAVDRFLDLPRRSPTVLLIGVRAALAQGDATAADNYARMLRRDFPSSAQTQALPQLLQGVK